METPYQPHHTLREIVTGNFRTAAVFESFGMDFCCRGGQTIEQSCTEHGADPFAVITALHRVTGSSAGVRDGFADLDPEQLIEFIVSHHHAYVRTMIPVLRAHTRKVAAVHGERHPETIAIAEHTEAVLQELASHMVKEERMLFPYIIELFKADRSGAAAPVSPFGTVQNPIRMMEQEHRSAGDELAAVRTLSSGYAPPADACTTYRICYQELQAFEKDLHQHIHLENNILFPRAVELEQAFASTH